MWMMSISLLLLLVHVLIKRQKSKITQFIFSIFQLAWSVTGVISYIADQLHWCGRRIKFFISVRNIWVFEGFFWKKFCSTTKVELIMSGEIIFQQLLSVSIFFTVSGTEMRLGKEPLYFEKIWRTKCHLLWNSQMNYSLIISKCVF